MSAFLLGSAGVLLASLALGLVRALRGPTLEDRMLAAQLTGTAGVGSLLLLAEALAAPALVDVALLLGLLAAVSVVALTRDTAAAEAGHD